MFKVEIDTSNAAFGETSQEEGDEIRRILQHFIDSGINLLDGEVRLRDINGNDCGRVWVEVE